MSKLDRIEIIKHSSLDREIRVAWDNDRHQMMRINGDAPQDVVNALELLAYDLRREIEDKQI